VARGPTGPRDFDFQEIPWDAIKRWAPVVVIVVVVLLLGKEMVYKLDAHENAVVLRFGKVLKTAGPGLHFKLPYIDQAIPVNMAERPVEIGFRTIKAGVVSQFEASSRRHRAQSLILTGDLNCADVQWTVQYQVVDPIDYLFRVENVEGTIGDISLMVMRALVGDMTLHEVITTGRGELQQKARTEVQKRLDDLNCGVAIRQMQITHAKPPEKVKQAFEAVNVARQGYDQAINEAEKRRNEIIPGATAQKTVLIREAEGYQAQVTKRAKGESEALLTRFEAYKLAPKATRQRLYIEAMEQVLQQVDRKVIIDASLKGVLPLLQLNKQGGAQ
jgi:modulator of FtsH protease HflK